MADHRVCVGLLLLAAALSAVLSGGCAADLPTYPAMSDADALRVIATRLNSVKSISAAAHLTLTNVDGQAVSMDGAFVARPPDRARLRAWKLNSPVLDVTIVPEGVWVFAATRDGAPSSDLTKQPSTVIARSVEVLSGEYFARAHATHAESLATLVAIGPAFGRENVRCEIDRASLTPRRFVLTGVGGDGEEAELTLGDYAMLGGTAWARRMEFRGASGTIVIQLDEIELNGELAETAFVPPGRAVRLP